ncbi:MAG: hypothetical protein NXY59_01005 [Aigarchaeota archaeon]|nr:hypothetical protein [Candidatus Pelearchaeum maunauluense]
MKARIKPLAILVLLISTLITTLPAGNAAAIDVLDVVWGSPESPSIASPGDRDATLTVVFMNREDVTICGIVATIGKSLGFPFPFKDREGASSIRSYLERAIAAQGIGSLQFKITIDEDALPGDYPADLRIEYRDCTDPDFPITTLTIPIVIRVSEAPAPVFLRSVWELDGREVSVGPGMGVAMLRVELEAPRRVSMANVVARLFLEPPLTNTTGGYVVETSLLKSMRSGEAFTLTFPIKLSDNVRLGTYKMRLQLTYTNQWMSKKSVELVFSASVNGREELRLGYEGLKLRAGDESALNLKLSNVGTAPIYKATVRAASGSPAALTVIDERIEIGSLSPGKTASLRIGIQASSTALEGVYPVKITVEYRDVLGNMKVEDFQAVVDVLRPAAPGLSAEVEGNPVKAAGFPKIKITYRNINPEEVRDITISLSLRGLPISAIGGELVHYVKALAPGEAYTAVYSLAVSPAAGDGVYEAVATVRYKTAGGEERVETLSIPLVVVGDIRLVFRGVEFSPKEAEPGGIVDVAGDLINMGASTARAVMTEIIGDAPLVAIPDSTSFIGTINPSQVSAFTLSFRVSDDAKPGVYSATIIAKYRDGFGREFKLEKTLEYVVGEKTAPASIFTVEEEGGRGFPASMQQTLLAVIAALAIIAAIVVVRRRRRG